MGIIVNVVEFQSADGQALTNLSIVYAEQDHQSEGVGRKENVTVDIGLLDIEVIDQIADLQDLSCDIVDAILLHQRNPPKEIKSKRFTDEEEEIDDSED